MKRRLRKKWDELMQPDMAGTSWCDALNRTPPAEYFDDPRRKYEKTDLPPSLRDRMQDTQPKQEHKHEWRWRLSDSRYWLPTCACGNRLDHVHVNGALYTPEDTQPDADRIDAAFARSFNDPSKPMLKPPEDTQCPDCEGRGWRPTGDGYGDEVCPTCST